MKKRLLIVGAGGHGRCCLDIAREQACYDEICFLDDAYVGQMVNDAYVIDDIAHLEKYIDESTTVFAAIGNNAVRKCLMEKVERCGGTITSLISKSSHISAYANIAKGSVIFPGTVIEANAVLGKGSIVAANAIINHDAVVEDYCLINSGSIVRPNTRVGTLSKIGCGCILSFGNVLNAESDVHDGKII